MSSSISNLQICLHSAYFGRCSLWVMEMGTIGIFMGRGGITCLGTLEAHLQNEQTEHTTGLARSPTRLRTFPFIFRSYHQNYLLSLSPSVFHYPLSLPSPLPFTVMSSPFAMSFDCLQKPFSTTQQVSLSPFLQFQSHGLNIVARPTNLTHPPTLNLKLPASSGIRFGMRVLDAW